MRASSSTWRASPAASPSAVSCVAQPTGGQDGRVGVLGVGGRRHVGEVPDRVRRVPPAGAGLLVPPRRSEGVAEREQERRPVRQRVSALPQAGRWRKGRADVLDRRAAVAGGQRRLGQRQPGPVPGPQDQALTALPGLEPPALQDGQRVGRPAQGQQQLGVLGGQVVPGPQRLRVLLQPGQPVGDRGADALGQLVALEEQPGVVGRGAQGPLVGGGGRGRVVLDVEGGDGEVAPDHRVGVVGGRRAAPQVQRPLGTPVGVAPVAEQGGRRRVVRVVREGRFQGQHVVQAGRVVPGPVARAGAVAGGGGPRRVAERVEPDRGVVVGQHGAGGLPQRPVGVGHPSLIGQVHGDGQLARTAVLDGHVEQGLRLREAVVGRERPGQLARPHVERVERQGLGQHGVGLVGPAEPAEQHDHQVSELEVVGGGPQPGLRPLQRDGVPAGARVDQGELVVGGAGPGCQPGGLGERLVGFRVAPLAEQGEPEQMVRVPGLGVGVEPGQPLDGGPGVLLGLLEAALLVPADAQRGVRRDVPGVAPQRLLPVRLRGPGGVPVLLQVPADQVELFDARYGGGGGRLDRRLQRGGRRRRGRLPPQQRTVGRPDQHGDVALGCHVDPGPGRRVQVHGRAAQHRPVRGRDADRCGTQGTGGVEHQPRPPADHLAAQREVKAGRDDHPGAGDGVPVLGEGLGLAWGEVGEVRLVLGVDAGHQLDVGPALLVEVPVPGAAELLVAPGPLLLADGVAVVGPVHEARPRPVVVPAEEVARGADGHVRRRHRDVAGPVQPVTGHPVRAARPGIAVAPGRVVDAVVGGGGCRERRDRPLGVVGHHRHVGGEERLVVVVHLRGHVGPPEERLRPLVPVEQPHPELDDGRPWSQPDPVHALHAGERVVVGAPDHALALVDLPGRRQEGGGPVVLRPVELDAARQPGSGQPDQGRLDDRVGVEQRRAGAPVEGQLDPTAELGQHQYPEVVVLQVEAGPAVVGAGLADPVVERQREDAARGALVDAAFQVGRVPVRFGGEVGRQQDRRGPGCDLDAHAGGPVAAAGRSPRRGRRRVRWASRHARGCPSGRECGIRRPI